jgi:hypothetical protein
MHQLTTSGGARSRVAITIATLAATLFLIQLAGSASAATKHHARHHARKSDRHARPLVLVS